MTSYDGRHAELYDLFYSSKLYKNEVNFLDNTFKTFGNNKISRILELACGTGEHAFELEKKGYEITATDYSFSMLTRALEKKESNNSRVNFYQKDMRDLRTINEKFDAIICLFDSIGYVQTNISLNEVFFGVNHCLDKGGLFLFEFWHAPAMLKHFEPCRVKNFFYSGDKVTRISETKINYKYQLAEVTYTVFEFKENSLCNSFVETQVNRFFSITEMESFLSYNGFEALKWYDGYTENENITDNSWHIFVVAKKIKQCV